MKYINYLNLALIIFFFHIKLFSIEIRIIAKVNNQIITNIDLENRLNLALAIAKIPDETEVRNRLKEQVLKILIDEVLKIQEAQKFNILISSDDINNEINRLERRLDIAPNSLISTFKKKKIPETTVYEQLRSQLLWNKLVSIRIANSINITDKQKNETFQNFIKNSGETEYNLSEIFVSLANSTNYSALEKANSMHTRLNSSNFISMAEQFSDGAINIGNRTRESLMSERVVDAIKSVQIGEITQPVESSIGYHIYLLNDKRKTKKIVENQILYNLSQIFFKFADNKQSEIKVYQNLLADLRKTTLGCDNLDNIINRTKKSSGGRLGILPEDSLDSKFSKLIKKGLKIGKLSEAIVTEQGIHSLMLCEPVIKVTYDNIKKNIEAQLKLNKINNGANLLLNRVRQRSLIEISTFNLNDRKS
jgi:peptidyl-prolyl cis-trans isomerase SurA